MRSVLRLSTSLYLTLSVLAGVPAGASRAVLCLAPNGHVAIEVGAGRCLDVPPIGEAADRAGSWMDAEDCDDCVDVPMGTPLLTEARGRHADAGSPAAPTAPLLASVVVAAPAVSIGARSTPEAALHTAFPPSRTTILRN